MSRTRKSILAIALGALALAAGYGAWRSLSVGPRPALDDPRLVAQLTDLGYIDWVDIAGDSAALRGVTLHDPTRAYPGVNLVCSHARSRAELIDMRGEVVHRWRVPGIDARWEHVEMTPEGELLVIVKARDGPFLMSLDWDSNVQWKRSLAAHHDIALTRAGEIHTLTSRVIEIPFKDRKLPIIDNSIVSLSPRAGVTQEISLFELFGDRISNRRFEKVYAQTGRLKNRIRRLFGRIEIKPDRMDLLHANSIQILDRRVEGLGAPGDVLIAIRELDLIAVVDPVRRAVVWTWGPGEVQRPHHPTLLDDGNILIFDNGSKRKYSRVIELDPRRRVITWQYVAEPRSDFFSHQKGAAQKLPNGNVLITDSLAGRAFEVTRNGDLVWEYYNPDIDEKNRKRAEIYRMTRLEASFVEAARARAGRGPDSRD